MVSDKPDVHYFVDASLPNPGAVTIIEHRHGIALRMDHKGVLLKLAVFLTVMDAPGVAGMRRAVEQLGTRDIGVIVRELVNINGLSSPLRIRAGTVLALDFSCTDRTGFEVHRRAYHRDLQEMFFADHRITGTAKYRIQAGDSLWRLADRYNGVPMWLLRQYNPDLDFATLQPGASVVVPVVESCTGDDCSAAASTEIDLALND